MGYPMMNDAELEGCRERALNVQDFCCQGIDDDTIAVCEDVFALLDDIAELKAVIVRLDRMIAPSIGRGLYDICNTPDQPTIPLKSSTSE